METSETLSYARERGGEGRREGGGRERGREGRGGEERERARGREEMETGEEQVSCY